MIQFHPKNPLRPTNWRWERARSLREAGKMRLAGSEDTWTKAALKLQLAQQRATEPSAQFAIAEAFPDLYYAHSLYRRLSGDENKHPLRYMIEARLLADETDEQISSSSGVDPEIIKWYEKIFFNVRDKLQYHDYILAVAIGPALYTGMSEREYDLLWKTLGYLYGTKVLNAFIKSTTKQFKPESDEEVEACIMTDASSALRRKAAIAARTYAINGFTQSDLLNTYTRFLELEKEGEGNTARDFYLNNVQFILNKLPWVAGDEKMDHPRLIPYDSQSAELRTDELLAIAAGRELADVAEFENMKFPEPASNEQTK